MKILGEIMIMSGIIAGFTFLVFYRQEYLYSMAVFGTTGIMILIIRSILK